MNVFTIKLYTVFYICFLLLVTTTINRKYDEFFLAEKSFCCHYTSVGREIFGLENLGKVGSTAAVIVVVTHR